MALKRKILFVYSDLNSGGITKVIKNILRYIDYNTFEITLLLYNLPDYNPFPTQVRIISINKPQRRGIGQVIDFFLRARAIAEKIESLNPEIVFSHFNRVNVNVLFAKRYLKFIKPKFIAVEHTSPAAEFSYSLSEMFKRIYHYPDNGMLINLLYILSNKLLKQFIKRYYPIADLIISVSEGIKAELENSFHVDGEKIKVVHNPVDKNEIENLSEEVTGISLEKGVINIVTAGRLERQKDHKTLIEAFSIFAKEYNSHLFIIGEGSYKKFLRELIEKKQLNEKVTLTGYLDNPYPLIKTADIFVLSSIYEGFGLVLVESMFLGTPVISTDCKSGPGEIVQNGENGMLVTVGKPAEIYQALKQIAENSELSKTIVENAKKRADDFSAEKITSDYEEILKLL